jgi:hypothetical protein
MLFLRGSEEKLLMPYVIPMKGGRVMRELMSGVREP